MTATEARKLSPEEIEQGMKEYLPLARSVVRRFLRTTTVGRGQLDLDELHGAALRGLWEALRSYDPDRGTKVRTWAVTICWRRVLDEVRNLTGARHQGGRLQRIGRSVQASCRLGYLVDLGDGSEQFDAPCPRAERTREATEAAELVEVGMRGLLPEEKVAVRMVWLEGATPTEAGQALGVGMHRVYQHLREAAPLMRARIRHFVEKGV